MLNFWLRIWTRVTKLEPLRVGLLTIWLGWDLLAFWFFVPSSKFKKPKKKSYLTFLYKTQKYIGLVNVPFFLKILSYKQYLAINMALACTISGKINKIPNPLLINNILCARLWIIYTAKLTYCDTETISKWTKKISRMSEFHETPQAC